MKQENKKTWITEVGTVLLAAGGAIQGLMASVDVSNWEFYSMLSDIAKACMAVGGALVTYRISKKAGAGVKPKA